MKSTIERAITDYNRYHVPEVVAALLSVEADSFTIVFTGSFCQTCGFSDYFDDYRIALEELGVTSDITEVLEVEEGAVVTFAVLHH